MDYRAHRINCSNYPWLARHFNKSHHEIENDPQVRKKVATLIDQTLLERTTVVAGCLPSKRLSLK
jgi:hypothetical protein